MKREPELYQQLFQINTEGQAEKKSCISVPIGNLKEKIEKYWNINRKIQIDWFQMTLYTRVLVNITKLMKKNPFGGASFSINI